MSAEPFLGEIQLVAGPYPPRGWAHCDGQLLSISQNSALFSLFGTNFGGDGRTTFGLPDLRGRIPVGLGVAGLRMGDRDGAESVALGVPQMPAHGHRLRGTGATAAGDPPDGRTPATGGAYAMTQDKTIMGPAVAPAGGSQAHPNVAPSAVLRWCIALQGIYPSRP